MNSANKFLMLLNVMFFIIIIGVVIYFQTSNLRTGQLETFAQAQDY